MKKITIIGANSYIARNLVHILALRKNEFEIKLYSHSDKQADGFEPYFSVDVLSLDDIRKIDMCCDIIFMFVGKTGSANGFDNAGAFLDVNQKALLNLLNEYRRQKSEAKVVFPSTRLVYKGTPGYLKEDAEKEFKSIYAINKFACEEYLKQYSSVFGIKYCILRICIPYGCIVGDTSSYGTIQFMMEKAKSGENIRLFGDGSVRRTLTYIEDLCVILITAAMSERCTNDIYNIGGENYSLKEIAMLIADKYNIGVDFIPYPRVEEIIESGDTVFDDSKLKGLIDLKYTMSFENWLRNNQCRERI